jgi:hypothetical protein
VAQEPVTAEWLNLTEVQFVVTWHVSQVDDVVMWVAVFPRASEPLWQLVQAPDTAEWSYRTLVQLDVTWQVSQFAAVGMCRRDFPGARRPLWQSLHLLGSAANWPPV